MAGEEYTDTVEPGGVNEGWWAAVLRDEPGAGPVVRRETYAPRAAAADATTDWEAARRLHETDETVELEVLGYNRGGLVVGLNALRGFVPASHLVDLPAQVSEEKRKAALAGKVGQYLQLKIIEYDPKRGRVVFSERAAQAGAGSRQRLLECLHPGDVVEGTVTNVCEFGAFVDLGGMEGLIHVSEISWNRMEHPRDVLCCNQPVKVSVISVDRAQGRVALSLKRLHPDPWAMVDQRYTVGQVVSGVVTNVVNFGAFVCLEEGVEGLIHISELAEADAQHPRQVVREGEPIQARVINVDGASHRIGLSLRVPAAEA